MTIEELKQKALSLTLQPGVYLMKDKQGTIIYVGKAKALKNRVVSYFRENSSHTEKVRQMVAHVHDFDYIVTGSEFEALVLECSLIKLHSPKYNILLKDDKGYHYIHISGGDYPRITAAKQKDGDGTYLGPYVSSYIVKQSVDEANRVFCLPSCSKRFPQEFRKSRPCLNYHIHRCFGLCQGKMGKEEYQKLVWEAVDYIKHGSVSSIGDLQKEMEEAAEDLDFERAARLRDRIRAIQKITATQQVLLDADKNLDVIAFAQNHLVICAVVIQYRDGRLMDKLTYFFEDSGDMGEVRSEFLEQYYAGAKDIARCVLLDEPPEDLELFEQFVRHQAGHAVSVSVPQKGDRKKLIEMAHNNALEQLSDRVQRTGKEVAALEQLGNLLKLPSPPMYIEAYDISNWGDTGRVGGMVVFENGRPLKSDYKRFAIKEVAGQDDFASMAEVLRRRMLRYKEGDPGFSRMPDLILLDGGKGQVSAVRKVFEELQIDVPLFGMVKDSRHRTRAIVNEEGEIALSAVKSAFTFVTSIQDEVHRFALAYQRTLHKKANYDSDLKKLPGIGDARAKALLREFRTKKRMLEASPEELGQAAKLPLEKAEALWAGIHEMWGGQSQAEDSPENP
ncbi:MAG TPA: excinuclease ABC subunit UvrC [Candidatus Merdivicinus intestinigallinarum]|nr:excinuclease ABC subunit UvrC [Candidatus Merdivicinus intestinigallinarum]